PGQKLVHLSSSPTSRKGAKSKLTPAEESVENENDPLLITTRTTNGRTTDASQPVHAIGFEISVENVSVQLRSFPLCGSAKSVLSNVSGAFHRGQFVAVMGPSGSGKTTFLNALFGGVSPGGGSLHLDGVPCNHFLREFRSGVGLVPQDDDTVDPL